MKIAILVHAAHGPRLRPEYLLARCASQWRAWGYEVRVHIRPEDALEADVVIPHLDQTRIEPRIVAALAAHPRVLNRAVVDISKRKVSRLILHESEPWDGPVIVKTDANYGGIADRRLVPAPTRLARGIVRRVRLRPPRLGVIREIEPSRYEVYESRHDVPPEVWGNPALVVERFRPERDGDLYCVRHYCFLGQASMVLRSKAREPSVKPSNVIERDVVDLDPAILARRRELGFDYGKFDYTLSAGQAHFFDANTTPSVGRRKGEAYDEIVRKLAKGIEGWSATGGPDRVGGGT